MEDKRQYVEKMINAIAKKLDIDISKYSMDEMIMGMAVELEHGSQNEKTNVTNDDPTQTFQIMLAHLDEIKDYYTRLKKMETDGKKNNPQSEDENKEESGTNEDENKEENLNESYTSKRNRELCGLNENVRKMQLKNNYFSNILKESISEETFRIEKFENDGTGNDEENNELYNLKKD